MKIITFSQGTTRNVVLIHPLGIALEFPRFDFFAGVKIILKVLGLCFGAYVLKKKEKKIDLRWTCKWILFSSYEKKWPQSLMYLWFRGIMANINEMRYWIFHYDNPLLMPTYFSLFGLVNIQPIVEPIRTLSNDEIYQKIYLATDIENEMDDYNTHAWEDINFTKRKDGGIAMYDYGSSRAFPMVLKYGYRFSQILKNAQK